MTQQDQYNKDAEALAGTGKEPWTLWQVWKDLANGVGWYACTRKPDFNDPDMKYYRRENADTLILQWQYEEDMAVAGQAQAWLDRWNEMVGR